jgi:hypothetical protein
VPCKTEHQGIARWREWWRSETIGSIPEPYRAPTAAQSLEHIPMTPRNDTQPDPGAALRINSGVNIPPTDVAGIAKMYQAAVAGREAIRAMRLGETEPATIFAPVRKESDGDDE